MADFREHWLKLHAPIALQEMKLRRYVQCNTIDSVYNFCEPQWDGISHLWFDDAEAAEREMAAAARSKALAEERDKFIGRSLNLFVIEHILTGPRREETPRQVRLLTTRKATQPAPDCTRRLKGLSRRT